MIWVQQVQEVRQTRFSDTVSQVAGTGDEREHELRKKDDIHDLARPAARIVVGFYNTSRTCPVQRYM